MITWNVTAQISSNYFESTSLESRITILERISNAQAQLLQKLQQQILYNQHDIDLLRGQIQQNDFNLNQKINSQKQYDQRTGDLFISKIMDNSDIEYNNAIALIIDKKKYELAANALQEWIIKYPSSSYQPNANYWLGQLFYNKGQKENSAYYFANVVKKYPKSIKASESLLKIGLIMQEKKELIKAKAVYKQIIKNFPDTNSAKQARKYLSQL
ncbi:tol-pal system protein YbgF [Pantoea sp. Aalb]|uniref:tol-pal system protein YbgF n=1 Tax=Pantoea sp. Aalb TaxID=2576762 RepID=UPI001F443E79|nr:tol-pal system protein YbgF [Pantoea sp. Aalb]